MTKINFNFLKNGGHLSIKAQNGISLMENAMLHHVDGIVAECGGACACATCHVYIDQAFLNKLDAPDMMEEDMLDFAYDVRENSRLSCQITVTDAFDGLVVYVPERQV